MKKVLLAAVVAASMVAYSCNPKEGKSTDKESTDKEDVVKEEKEEEQDDFDKAAAAYCKCYQNNEESIPLGLKKLIKNASKAENPQESIREDYANLTAEEQKAFDEVMGDEGEMNQCFEKVKKKYSLDDKDVASLKKLKSSVAGQEDCGFINDALTLAISMNKGQKQNRTNRNDDDVPEE